MDGGARPREREKRCVRYACEVKHVRGRVQLAEALFDRRRAATLATTSKRNDDDDDDDDDGDDPRRRRRHRERAGFPLLGGGGTSDSVTARASRLGGGGREPAVEGIAGVVVAGRATVATLTSAVAA